MEPLIMQNKAQLLGGYRFYVLRLKHLNKVNFTLIKVCLGPYLLNVIQIHTSKCNLNFHYIKDLFVI